MLADLSAFADLSERQKIAKSMMEALSHAIRDTDVKGWHIDCLVIGIMFTKITSKKRPHRSHRDTLPIGA